MLISVLSFLRARLLACAQGCWPARFALPLDRLVDSWAACLTDGPHVGPCWTDKTIAGLLGRCYAAGLLAGLLGCLLGCRTAGLPDCGAGLLDVPAGVLPWLPDVAVCLPTLPAYLPAWLPAVASCLLPWLPACLPAVAVCRGCLPRLSAVVVCLPVFRGFLP